MVLGRRLWCALLLLAVAAWGESVDSAPAENLEERVKKLEERISQLEQALGLAEKRLQAAAEGSGGAETTVSLADPAKSAGRARSWGAGVNWHLNRSVKLALDYERTKFKGGAAGGDRESEGAVLSRLQLAF